MILNNTAKHPVIQYDNPALEEISAKFPSFNFFYASDDKIMLDVANSLLIMDHLIDGTKNDYLELIRLQKKDVLTISSFVRLSCFFSRFRYKKDLRDELALFIYLDGLCRTAASKKLVIILPADQRGQNSRDSLALAILNNRLLTEVQRLHRNNNVKYAFSYRLYITNRGPGQGPEFSEDVVRIAQAGVICDIAGLPHNINELGASQLLSESMAKQLLGYIEKAYLPEYSRELCSLTID